MLALVNLLHTGVGLLILSVGEDPLLRKEGVVVDSQSSRLLSNLLYFFLLLPLSFPFSFSLSLPLFLSFPLLVWLVKAEADRL